MDEDYKRYYPYGTWPVKSWVLPEGTIRGIVGLEVIHEGNTAGENPYDSGCDGCQKESGRHSGERRIEASARIGSRISIDRNIQE